MPTVETIKVNIKGHEGPITINEEDFDKTIHTTFKEKAAPAPAPVAAAKGTPAPEAPLALSAAEAAPGPVPGPVAPAAEASGWGDPAAKAE